MARLVPAACKPWAMAHAMERLLATPKTTAVRPFKSSNMKNSPDQKPSRIAARAFLSSLRRAFTTGYTQEHGGHFGVFAFCIDIIICTGSAPPRFGLKY